MHDEDSRNGVEAKYVANQYVEYLYRKNAVIKKTGERCYFEEETIKQDAIYIKNVVVEGFFDLVNYYLAKPEKEEQLYSALKFAPVVIEKDLSPMFVVEGKDDAERERNAKAGNVKIRKDLANFQCAEYISAWNPIDILREIFKKQIIKFCKNDKNLEQEEIQKLENKLNKITSLDEGEYISCRVM